MTRLSFHRLLTPLACAFATACGGGGGVDAPAPPADTVPPTVSAVTPVASSTRIAATSAVTVSFSEPVNCVALTSGAISLFEGTTPVAGATTCSGNTLTFTAASELPTNATLTASVSTTVKDLASNSLASPYTWSFGVAPWTLQIGTPTFDDAYALAIDGAGNLYVAGDSNGNFDGNVNVGTFDAVLIKYDKFGVKQWSRQLGTTGIDSASAVAMDSVGNIFVGGTTDGNLDANPANATTDGFIAKYDSSGRLLWVRQLHTDQTDFVRALATDIAGNVIAVGYTDGSLFGPSAGGTDLFVVKYDSNGTMLWASQLGTASVDNAGGVTTDAAGNVYVAGYTGGSLDGNVSAGGIDIVLIKYNSAGVKQWTRQVGTTGTDVASAIAIDATGNLYAAGRSDGVLGGTSNAGGLDAVVMKFDSTGTVQWVRQIGSTADDYAYGVAVDAAGNVVVAGYTNGGLDGNTSAGAVDAFVAKYDSTGTKLWSRQTGTAGNDFVYAVGVDSSGNVYAAGTTDGAIDGNVNAGSTDLFIVKYQADGTKR